MAQKIDIPRYYVYGEAERGLEAGFMHVELVSARKNLHRGDVKAHQHPAMAQITFWTKGSGLYFIEDETWSFSGPAVSFLPSGVVHGFKVKAHADAIVLSLANDVLQQVLGGQNLGAGFYPLSTNSDLRKKLENCMGWMLQEHQMQTTQGQDVLLHLVGLALNMIKRLEQVGPRRTAAQQLPLGLRLQNCIDAHFREAWTIADYVSELHSTYHLLDKAAQAVHGQPVKAMVMRRRLLEAKRLLKFTVRSADAIAFELGFNDPAYFNRMFKQHVGLAPGQWRGQNAASTST